MALPKRKATLRVNRCSGIKFNAACPGFTSTNLNNYDGTRTVEQATREPVRLALLGPDGPTRTVSNEERPLPW